VGHSRAGWGGLWIIFSIVLLLTAGCGDEKAERLHAELSRSKRTIQVLTAEKNRLAEQMDQLRNACDELQSEYDNLKVKDSELAQWSQQMAKRFGPGVWYFSPDEKPLPYKSIPNATPDRLVGELNALFKRSHLPRVILTSIKGHTAYVRISGERQLTQQMGSTGATGYIQVVTYTLTSLPAIRDVDFDFKAGDHAVPGRYSR
jgi:hypothetical protein